MNDVVLFIIFFLAIVALAILVVFGLTDYTKPKWIEEAENGTDILKTTKEEQ